MKYNLAYHLLCELELDCGRQVRLHELLQRQTYWGLLGGHPNSKSNDSKIEREKKEAEQHRVAGRGQVHLIQPGRRNFQREPGDMDQIQAQSTRNIEWLPMVRCIGIFSSEPARDKTMHQSYLTVLWFQDEFAMPIVSEIAKSLKAMNWNELATDYDYD